MSLLFLLKSSEVSSFPVQYSGLKCRTTSGIKELCLVAENDAPASMGGIIKIRKAGSNYAVYLVETNDVNASPVRVRTNTGIKSIRFKT